MRPGIDHPARDEHAFFLAPTNAPDAVAVQVRAALAAGPSLVEKEARRAEAFGWKQIGSLQELPRRDRGQPRIGPMTQADSDRASAFRSILPLAFNGMLSTARMSAGIM